MNFQDEQSWRPLADAFREEIQEYGGLLQLMERQQQGILNHEVDSFQALNSEIEEQLHLVNRCRQKREILFESVQHDDQNEEEGRFSAFINQLPEAPRGMFSAYREEGKNIMRRVQHTARQNKMLLSRATQLSQEVLSMLRPGSISRTYGARGQNIYKVAQGGAKQLRSLA